MSGGGLRLGLVGQGIGHSLSPRLHTRLLACAGLSGRYQLFDVADCAAPLALLRRGELDGLNVTTPFKRQAAAACAPPLDTPVNTLRAVDGALQGWSSDGPGFVDAAEALWRPLAGARVLLLGTGGAAESLLPSLRAAGAEVQLWGRDPVAAAALAQRWGCAVAVDGPPPQVLIHATRWGHGERGPPPSAGISPLAFAWPSWPGADVAALDLVYSGAGPTWFEALAAARRLRVIGGFGRAMLAAQAARSFAWWSGVAVPWAAIADEIAAPTA